MCVRSLIDRPLSGGRFQPVMTSNSILLLTLVMSSTSSASNLRGSVNRDDINALAIESSKNFNLETGIRQLIQEMVDPVLKK